MYKSITGRCVVTNKENTITFEYVPVDFVGDAKTHYKLVSAEYNSMCENCTLENNELHKLCEIHKKAHNY